MYSLCAIISLTYPTSGMTDTLRSDVMSSLRSDYWSPKTQRKKATLKYPPEIEKALDAVKFIADHLRDEDKDEQVSLH